MRALRALAASLMLAAACAGRSNTAVGTAPAPGNSNVISAEELADPLLATSNLLEAIRRLRPRFLSSHGVSSVSSPSSGLVHVSIDGGPLVAPENLKTFLPANVKEVRYLSAADAGQVYGVAANGGGVILVRSK